MLLLNSHRMMLASQPNSTETSPTPYPAWWSARGHTQNLQFCTAGTPLRISLVRQIISTVAWQCVLLLCDTVNRDIVLHESREPLVRRACNKSQNSLWGLAKVTVSCRQKRSRERQIAQKVNIEPHLTSLLEPLLHSECYYVNSKNDG